MYSTPVVVKTVSGKGNMIALIDSMIAVAQPTVGDLLYAGQRQRTRIVERTARGVDVNESAFAPYSTNGPYYYYPSKTAKNRRAGVLRTAKKIGVKVKGGPNREGASVTRVGIKFANYGAFKRAFGRPFVDLRGINAPHMLQAILVKVAGFVLGGTQDAVDAGNAQPANEIILGIYGEEAERASGHNEGTRYLPKRKFFGANENDKAAILSDIVARISARVRKSLA